ncbi:hypothetical protein MASR2M78_13570 [Treponema sp.]
MSTVLIVDDEETIREVATAILQKAGHQCVSAVDAAQAIDKIQAHKLDVALVDVILPGRGGLDLLMEIRRDFPALPVVVMSGKVKTNTLPFQNLARQFGAGQILSKPFTSEELVSAVESVLQDDPPTAV